jgi:hypothetical protein
VKTYSFQLNKQKVYLIDTPAFDDTYRVDSDVLKDLAYWLTVSYKVRKIKLTGIVYLHRITDVTMTGNAFKNLKTFKLLVGKQSMSSVILATTMWDHVSPKDGKQRESELIGTAGLWGDMIREGSITCRHTDNYNSAINIISNLISKHTTTVLGLQKEMVDENKPLNDTDAGREIGSEIIKQRELFQRRLQDSRQEMADAIAHQDKKVIERFLREQNLFLEKIIEAETSSWEIQVTMEKLIQDRDEQYKKEMAELNKILQAHKTRVQNKDTELAQERHRMEDLQRQQALYALAQQVQAINRQRELQEAVDQPALYLQQAHYQQAISQMATHKGMRAGVGLGTKAMIAMACAGLCSVM